MAQIPEVTENTLGKIKHNTPEELAEIFRCEQPVLAKQVDPLHLGSIGLAYLAVGVQLEEDPPPIEHQEKSEPPAEYIVELARRHAAASISVQLGESLQSTYKRYCNGRDPGKFWIELAELSIAVGSVGSVGDES